MTITVLLFPNINYYIGVMVAPIMTIPTVHFPINLASKPVVIIRPPPPPTTAGDKKGGEL